MRYATLNELCWAFTIIAPPMPRDWTAMSGVANGKGRAVFAGVKPMAEAWGNSDG